MKRKNLTEVCHLPTKLHTGGTKKDSSSQSDGSSHHSFSLTVKQRRLGSEFYDQECVQLSKSLLGKILVRELNGVRLSGRIVETEAYLGRKDPACHSYEGRKTHSRQAMWMDPGTLYVYIIYGIYHCMNISSREDGSVVLLRGLEPLDGENMMQKLRSKKQKSKKQLNQKALCSGPGKLTDALQITKALFDKESLVTNSEIWVEDAPLVSDDDIVCCPRIGLESAPKESQEKPLRFYIRGNSFVSKRNKTAEKQIGTGSPVMTVTHSPNKVLS